MDLELLLLLAALAVLYSVSESSLCPPGVWERDIGVLIAGESSHLTCLKVDAGGVLYWNGVGVSVDVLLLYLPKDVDEVEEESTPPVISVPGSASSSC